MFEEIGFALDADTQACGPEIGVPGKIEPGHPVRLALPFAQITHVGHHQEGYCSGPLALVAEKLCEGAFHRLRPGTALVLHHEVMVI
jgi:hypothetical protein